MLVVLIVCFEIEAFGTSICVCTCVRVYVCSCAAHVCLLVVWLVRTLMFAVVGCWYSFVCRDCLSGLFVGLDC